MLCILKFESKDSRFSDFFGKGIRSAKIYIQFTYVVYTFVCIFSDVIRLALCISFCIFDKIYESTSVINTVVHIFFIEGNINVISNYLDSAM